MQILKQILDKQEVDAILIFKGENLLYLTNFTGFEGVLLYKFDKIILYVDGRYIQQAEKEVYDNIEVKEFNQNNKFYDLLKQDILRYKIKNLGFEASYLTYDKYLSLKDNLDVKLKSIKDLDKIRMIKTKEEIKYLKEAQLIAEQSLYSLQENIKSFINLTELDFRNALVCKMYELGSLKESFDTIVAYGKEASKPHAKPGKNKIKEGNVLLVDFGAIYNYYHSDMTRIFKFLPIDKEIEKVYDIVLQAQNEAIKMIKEGVKIKDLDLKAREVMRFYGYEKFFKHSLGHGVGLEIHEYPYIHSKNEDILKEGMVITIEPGIYIENKFGIRIEDMILVKKDGYENLTLYEK